MPNKTNTAARLDSAYRIIGQQILKSIEERFGKKWRAMVSDDIARALIAERVLYGFVMPAMGGTAVELRDHAAAARNAAETLAGLES